jgi:hypothetical protein
LDKSLLQLGRTLPIHKLQFGCIQQSVVRIHIYFREVFMRKSALITASAFIGLASLVAGGTAASASSVHAPKAAGVTSFTLNLLGAPITVGVTTGVDGSLTNVDLAPITGLAPTAAAINKVSFSNVAGTASVTVRANHGGQSVTIRSTSLADLAGIANGWTGDVFGSGVDSSVTFDIVDTAGTPSIDGVKCLRVTAPTCEVQPIVVGHDDDDNEGSSASASVLFTSDTGATRTLRIRVGMHTDDGNTQAVVRMSLSRITEADIVGLGDNTWTGTLCDLSTGAINYKVAEGGIVTVPTPGLGQTVAASEHGGVIVTFATGEQVRISASGTGDTTLTRVQVRLRCPQDLLTINSIAPDPSIVSGDDDGDDDHGDHSDDDDGDDHGSDHGGDHGGSRGGNGGSDDVKGHG